MRFFILLLIIIPSTFFRQESSLYTPFEVMFGRRAVLPIDIDEGDPTESNLDDDIGEAMQMLTDNRLHMLKEVWCYFSYIIIVSLLDYVHTIRLRIIYQEPNKNKKKCMTENTPLLASLRYNGFFQSIIVLTIVCVIVLFLYQLSR